MKNFSKISIVLTFFIISIIFISNFANAATYTCRYYDTQECNGSFATEQNCKDKGMTICECVEYNNTNCKASPEQTTIYDATQNQNNEFTPQVQGLKYSFQSSDTTTGNIARYVQAIYKYAIGIVGILAAVVLMIGGVMWIVAGGNVTKIGEAKSWIGASLTGLILALCSYLILATVNPALVNFKTSTIETVEKNKETEAAMQSDAEIRSILDKQKIYANKLDCGAEGQTNCTSVAYLPQNAVDGLIKIKNDSGVSYITITGGTEAGHTEHGANLPVVDLRYCQAPCNSITKAEGDLAEYIAKQVGLGSVSEIKINQRYIATDGNFDVIREKNDDGSQHFHIRFK